MNHFFNDDERLRQTFGIKYRQVPKTRFIDNLDAVKVTLINWPDQERIKKHMINFATSSWFPNFAETASSEDYDAALKELLSGKILAQGLEGFTVSFLVEGLSLHGSHSIVRTRIGASYLQQSQAVGDLRHCDILVPRAFQKQPAYLENYFKQVQNQKTLYAGLLDSGTVANTDARFVLPKTIPVWLNISMTLPAILNVYSKRTDVTEEHPEMNIFAEKLRTEITKIFPWIDPYFKRDSNCIHRFEGYRSNCIFKRDGNDVLPEGAKQNWHLHSQTKRELMTDGLYPLTTRYFLGFQEVTKQEYEETH